MNSTNRFIIGFGCTSRKEEVVLQADPPAFVVATVARKRSHATPAAPVPAVKRSKGNTRTGPTNILSLSDIELEEEEEVAESGRGGVTTEPSPAAPAVNGFCSGRGSPTILMNEDEIDRKVCAMLTIIML